MYKDFDSDHYNFSENDFTTVMENICKINTIKKFRFAINAFNTTDKTLYDLE